MGVLAEDVGCQDAPIVSKRPCGPDAFVVEVELPEALGALAPGRFAMLSPADDTGPVIPRPFSVYDQISPTRLSFLVQVIGPGTKALDAVRIGEELTCTVPLGNGFKVAPAEREVVMVAGGVGSAPFLLYGRRRAEAGAGARTHYLYGARSADRLYDREAFAALDMRTVCATDDGSLGFAGNVVACLHEELRAGRIGRDALFCGCGPEGMLHGFAAYAQEHGLDAELSLETYMGCGYGVCNACPTKTRPGGPLGDWPYAKTCLDGPVFALSAIEF